MWLRISKYCIVAITLLIAIHCNGQNSLLWRFYGGELKDTSYLYGTAHVTDDEVFRFDSLVYSKINSCEMLTGELNMDSINMMEVIGALFMKNGTTLQNLVSKEDYKLVSVNLKEELGPLAAFADHVKPLFLIMVIQADPQEMQKENISKTFLDDHLQNYAQKNGLDIRGLETLSDQVAAIDKISYEIQAKMLIDYLSEAASTEVEDSLQSMLIDSYIKQDLEALMFMIIEDRAAYPEDFFEAFLYTRNKNMTKKLVEYSKEGPVFHTFGAGHLAGKKGIVALLRDQGYTVEPIYFSFY